MVSNTSLTFVQEPTKKSREAKSIVLQIHVHASNGRLFHRNDLTFVV